MVRYLILLLLFTVLSSTKCGHNKTPGQDNEATTVYITTTGAKYHNGNCRSVKKSKIAIPLPEAVAKGYEPCKLCHPPVADSIKQ